MVRALIYSFTVLGVLYSHNDIFVNSVTTSSEQLICNRLNASLSWTCTKKSDCKWWKEFSSRPKLNVVCSADRRSAKNNKICCPHVKPKTSRLPNNISSTTSTTTVRPTTTTTTARAVTSTTASPITSKTDPYAVAFEKCLEYAKFRYVNETGIKRVPGEPPVTKTKLDCVFVTTLIVGGVAVKEKEYPHMALIGYREDVNEISWNCGGSLISEQYIMSAAHCTEPSILGKAAWALLGVLSKEKFTPSLRNKNLFRIVDHFNHPDYRGPEFEYNDIALYKLEVRVPLSPSIRPACLCTTTEIPYNYVRENTVTGWGVTGYGDAESERLLKATINFLSDDLCVETYKNEPKYNLKGFNATTMVCAGHLTEAKDTCVGDSGGPLQIPLRSIPCMWTQVAITSFGSAFCGTQTPAIYTKVAYFVPWIQKIVWP